MLLLHQYITQLIMTLQFEIKVKQHGYKDVYNGWMTFEVFCSR